MGSETNPEIYLASHSPRRRERLQQIGLPYAPLDVSVDETYHEGESPEVFVIRLALQKARAGWSSLNGNAECPVLGADTIVVLDEKPMGKPANKEEAVAMLEALSGIEHQVYTGVALVGDREATRLSVNRVRFRELSELDIERYWLSGEPLGKAGGYAIQGRAGVFVEHLEGSYSGVMGLPLFETADLLDEFSIDYCLHWVD